MPDNSVHAVVTDPPAGIAFMGKAWDKDKGGRDQWIGWLSEVMCECLRVLKPGGHAFVWALPRTSHWTAMALEDAGFEMRDCVYHLFGSGFPKSMDVSKAIDKAAGAERAVIGPKVYADGTRAHTSMGHHEGYVRPFMSDPDWQGTVITAPATPEAQQWNGWGTALKPAAECWWLARKPLAGKTVAANVLEHGTGAMNVDGCRIGTTKDVPASSSDRMGANGIYNGGMKALNERSGMDANTGRWPSNVLLDEDAAQALDAQSGERPSRAGKTKGLQHSGRHGGLSDLGPNLKHGTDSDRGYGNDTGGASRFFAVFEQNAEPACRFLYQPKASKRERGEGNVHPTVKPLSLMRWLVRLITPPGGIVLDPFMGSGTTGLAAQQEGVQFVGIEQAEEYIEIALRRLSQSVLPLEVAS